MPIANRFHRKLGRSNIKFWFCMTVITILALFPGPPDFSRSGGPGNEAISILHYMQGIPYQCILVLYDSV